MVICRLGHVLQLRVDDFIVGFIRSEVEQGKCRWVEQLVGNSACGSAASLLRRA